jgi:hypothetical protein
MTAQIQLYTNPVRVVSVITTTRLNMDFYKLQKEAIESYVLCFNFFFEKVLTYQRLSCYY